MTPEDFSTLYLQYQSEDPTSLSELLQFTLPQDLVTTKLGKHGEGSAAQQPGRGPRGGKKPPRPLQQQLNTLEAELELKLQELKAAQVEHERLQQRIKVLEVVLPVRERHVQMLKQRRQVAHGPLSAHIHTHINVPRITELRAVAASGGFSSSGSETGRTCDALLELGAEPSDSAAMAATACQRHAALIRGIQGPADHTKIDLAADIFTSGRIALFTSLPAHNRVPRQVLQQVFGLLKQWVREAGLVLHAHDARPHDPGPQHKLAQLFDQFGSSFYTLRLDHANLPTELMCMNLETGERVEPPPESYWIPVAQGLRLSPEQVADAEAALALYSERTAKALEDRRRLAAQLTSRLASLQGRVQLHGPGGSDYVKVGQLALEVDEVAAKLYRNVMDQGSTLEVVKDFMAIKLFSPVQMARAAVLSYPYFPDVIAILSSLDATSPNLAIQRCETIC